MSESESGSDSEGFLLVEVFENRIFDGESDIKFKSYDKEETHVADSNF